jgi:hypothetical protein
VIYAGFKLLFNIPRTNKALRFIFGWSWFIGLILSVYVTILVVKDFNVKANTSRNFSVLQPKSNILYLKIKPNEKSGAEPDEEYEEGINIHRRKMVIIANKKWNLTTFDEKEITLGPPVLNIIPSETDSFELIVTASARGELKKDAMNRAKKIKYSLQQTDSLIEFDNVFETSAEDKWRMQEIQLTLKVPKNKMIYLDKSMKHIIYDIKNTSNTLDEDMVKRRWIMGNNELKCIDCAGLDVSSDEMGIAPPAPAEPAIPKSSKK